jgi:hypothetical protein
LLRHAGLIPGETAGQPFVLSTHADEGTAEDYNAYREAHRDKLIAFLDEYLVPRAP